MAAEAVRQGCQQRTLAEAPPPFLQVRREETIAADPQHAIGRRGDRNRAGRTIDPRSIFGIDIVARRLRDQGVARRRRGFVAPPRDPLPPAPPRSPPPPQDP